MQGFFVPQLTEYSAVYISIRRYCILFWGLNFNFEKMKSGKENFYESNHYDL